MSAGQLAQFMALGAGCACAILALVYGACRAVYGAQHHADEAAGRRRRRRAARIERHNARGDVKHVQRLSQPSTAPRAGDVAADVAGFGIAGRPQVSPHREPRHPQHGTVPPVRRVPRIPSRAELDGVLFEAHQILDEQEEGGHTDG